MRRAGLGLLLLLVGAGCPSLHPGYTDSRCRVTAECFQGEVCVEQRCVLASSVMDQLAPADLAVLPDGAAPPDAAMQQVDAAMQQVDAAMQQVADQ